MGPNYINPITPGTYFGPYYHIGDLLPGLTVPGDMDLFQVQMSLYGGQEYNISFPINYGKFFFDGASDIGIDTGLVLSSGRVLFLSVPVWWSNDPGTYPGIPVPAFYSSTGPNPGLSLLGTTFPPNVRNAQYADLVALNNGDSITDANVLDFDLVPKGDHIRLQYVFASEEYPENSCGLPNDVMGIFLSGPGIAGYENIALVPGSTAAVGRRSGGGVRSRIASQNTSPPTTANNPIASGTVTRDRLGTTVTH